MRIERVKLHENGSIARVDAAGLHYKELNSLLRSLVADGAERIELLNVAGQRYIGTDLDRPVQIDIFGVPGNDMGAFMDGPRITVHGNAQDGCGNTMNSGTIIIHGLAGDITGLSARGGKIFVRDDVGYRAGVHMKEFGDKRPILVIGGTAQDFLGEYMAGGVLVLLGLTLGREERHRARFIGTGMHCGVMYIRGTVEEHQLGKEVGVAQPDEGEEQLLRELVREYCGYFKMDPDEVLDQPFRKFFPLYLRPYGPLYAPTHRGSQGLMPKWRVS
jgi:glutamate synthase domain-containing protein 3